MTRVTSGRRWLTMLCWCLFAGLCGTSGRAHAVLPTPTATRDCPRATPEPLFVDPVVSPTDELQQDVVVRIGNGDRVEVTAESGDFVAEGDFSASPAFVGVGLLPGRTHHLEVLAHVREAVHDGCAYGGYTLHATTDFHGAPLTIIQGSDHGPTIAVDPPTLTLFAASSFTITVRNTGPSGEVLEITFLQFHHAYSQGDYGTAFSWDTSQLSLPIRLAVGEAIELPVTYHGGATDGIGSRLVLQIVSNARNNRATQYLAYFGRPGPTPTPTPHSSGCERELQSMPPHGPAGTVVELSGDCYPIHSGRSASVFFDGEMIGAVGGETGGDYQNLVRIPVHASLGPHELRIEQSLVRSSTVFDVTPARFCVGDCNGDGAVAISELITGVNIALAQQPLAACPPFDADADATVTVDELIAAVAADLGGCIAARPPESFAGEYVLAISDASDFSPGAVLTSTVLVTTAAPRTLSFHLPYWTGSVHLVATFSLDGSVALQGSSPLGDGSNAPVSGEAFVVSDGEQRWITGRFTFDRFGRVETVHFVLRRGAP